MIFFPNGWTVLAPCNARGLVNALTFHLKTPWHLICVVFSAMSTIEQYLILKARQKYAHIYPCNNAASFDGCFTTFNGKYIFWFNTDDNSTHTLVHDPADQRFAVPLPN